MCGRFSKTTFLDILGDLIKKSQSHPGHVGHYRAQKKKKFKCPTAHAGGGPGQMYREIESAACPGLVIT